MRAFAPGRVNIIGGHTDYTGGLVLPMAIELGTTVDVEPGGDAVELASADEPAAAVIALDVDDPAAVEPAWARYVAGVVAELHLPPGAGGRGRVTTTLPIGAGLSSSAALEVAVALALGFAGPAAELALLCQRAEHAASGVPCGIMDQLTSAAGVEGHALLIDCTSLEVTPIALPEEVDLVVVDSGEPRRLADTPYAERRSQAEAAAARIGSLRSATLDDVRSISDPELRRRAHHVMSENLRVAEAAELLGAGDVAGVGRLMAQSHASLRDDFEVTTPALDALVERLIATPGVHGARLTGAGFGGAVVALADRAAEVDGLRFRPAAGARVLEPLSST